MRVERFFPASIALLILTACIPVPEDRDNKGESDYRPATTGPCVGGICLGISNPPYVSDCSANLANTKIVEIKHCALQAPVSVSGANAVSGHVTLLNGKSARAILQFEDTSCDLLQSSLYRTLGESNSYFDREDNYRRLYSSVGHNSSIRPSSPTGGGTEWKTPNGRFVLSRNFSVNQSNFSVNQSCELYVDSLQSLLDLDDVISSAADDSISG